MLRAITCAALFIASPVSGAQAKSLKEQFVGTWSLFSIVNTNDSGEKATPYGDHPLGTYMFDETGHFAEIIVNPDKEGVAISFFGTFSADDDKAFVLHVVGSSVKRFIGTDAKRTVVSISDDAMETNNPTPSRGGGSAEATWKRVK